MRSLRLIFAALFLAASPCALLAQQANPTFTPGILAASKKIAEGIADLEKLAAQGDGQAAYLVGSLYLNGIFVRQDIQKGVAYYVKAAEAGDPDGLYYMGIIYLNGAHGQSIDVAKGSDLVRKSAQKGHVFAKQAEALLPK